MLAERLKYARNTLGLTLEGVKEATSIGVSSLSEYESGIREPKFSALKQLADAYQRPLGFFMEEGPIQPNVVLWRAKPEQLIANEIQAQLETLAGQYHNLEIWCDEHEPCELPFASKPTASEFYYRHATKLANEFRGKFGLGNQPGQSLLRVLEETCKVKVFHLSFEPSGSAACCLNDRFGAVILLNAKNTRWRRNFDLAHELFHLLTWKIFRQNDSEDGVEAAPQEEKLATCFARNLLMPEGAFRQAVDEQLSKDDKLGFAEIFEIARQFDVSIEAVLRQFSFVIHQISEEQIHNLIQQWRTQTEFWDTREQDEPPKRPLRFLVLAVQALRHGAISTGRYAEYVGISRREAMNIVEQEAEEDAKIEIAYS